MSPAAKLKRQPHTHTLDQSMMIAKFTRSLARRCQPSSLGSPFPTPNPLTILHVLSGGEAAMHGHSTPQRRGHADLQRSFLQMLGLTSGCWSGREMMPSMCECAHIGFAASVLHVSASPCTVVRAAAPLTPH